MNMEKLPENNNEEREEESSIEEDINVRLFEVVEELTDSMDDPDILDKLDVLLVEMLQEANPTMSEEEISELIPEARKEVLDGIKSTEAEKEAEKAEQEREQTREEITTLALELQEGGEVFTFSGIEEENYLNAKAQEEEYPGYTTPIDEIIERCNKEGIKVVLGDSPESGNVFILPAGSNDLARDSIYPRQLKITDEMDERIKRLILLKQSQSPF
jgi:hypothetical protein